MTMMLIWDAEMLQEVSIVVGHRNLRRLGHLARMPDDKVPKRVLFGQMDGTAVDREVELRGNGHFTLGRTLNLQVSHSIIGGPSKTGCLGQLP